MARAEVGRNPLPRLSEAVFDREFWADKFPGAHFGCSHDLTPDLPQRFEAALATGREEALQQLLSEHPYLIQYAIAQSGHHGIWAFPKQMIRPSASTRAAGLIPDFLVATASSLGYFWHVVELKRADRQFANSAGNAMSTDGHRAVTQCTSYLVQIGSYIESVRANIAVPEVVQPVGGVILMGDAKRETPEQQRIRSDQVRANPRISVVSYDRIRRGLANDVRHRS